MRQTKNFSDFQRKMDHVKIQKIVLEVQKENQLYVDRNGLEQNMMLNASVTLRLLDEYHKWLHEPEPMPGDLPF